MNKQDFITGLEQKGFSQSGDSLLKNVEGVEVNVKLLPDDHDKDVQVFGIRREGGGFKRATVENFGMGANFWTFEEAFGRL